MKKVLILAYDFPPYVSVAGLRPYSWYKYLHLFDVYPVIVTRQWENKFGNALDYISPGYSNVVENKVTQTGTLIEAPYKSSFSDRMYLKFGKEKFRTLRRLITSYNEFLQFILPVGKKKNLYFAADEYLKNNNVDCIIATGDPYILFSYASKLSAKYSIPWIADYRDPWIQDTTMINKIYKEWCTFFERKIQKNVSRIITVSSYFQKLIAQNVKNKKFEVLINGYDPEITEVTKGIKQTSDKLTIGLTGTVEKWHPIENIVRVCSELADENPRLNLELHFYGINKEKEITELLDTKYRAFKKSVNFYSKINNLDFAKSIAKHNVFLLLNSYSVLGTKIFDFLALKRKIILCYENDPEAAMLKDKFFRFDEIKIESQSLQADMITETNSGIVVRDSKHLKTVLKQLNAELEAHGFIECRSENVEKYSRLNRVERLAEIIKEVSKNN